MAATVFFSVSMSLDGFIAPGSLGELMGKQWMELQQWIFPQRFFRENLKLGEGGEEGRDNDIARETFERTGASVMGKRMFDAGEQMWPEEAPFHTPVFVVTHEKRDPWERPGGTTFHFVNDGIEAALDQAREAAGDRDVRIAGGGETILEYVNAGLIDEFSIALVTRAVRRRHPPVRGRGRGPRGPGTGPRGALPKGDAPDLRSPGAVAVSASSLRGAGLGVVVVGLAVMMPAQELEVVEVGGAAAGPVHTMVGFATFGGLIAAGGSAVAVADHECFPLRGRDGAGRAADVEDLGIAGHHDPRHIRVAQDPFQRRRADPAGVVAFGPRPFQQARGSSLVGVDDVADVGACRACGADLAAVQVIGGTGS